jgi:hypothetical protein
MLPPTDSSSGFAAVTTHPPPLSPDCIAFLHGRVSIIAASRSAGREPHLVRAVGCHIDATGERVTLLLAISHAGELLADIRANGRIAVVFSEPSSHRTVQLKGSDAAAVPLEEEHCRLLAAYRQRMVPELAIFGFDEAWVRALLGCSGAEIVPVRFTPREAWLQTPGPQAGEPLREAP